MYKPRFYLAGKVSENDWRRQLVPGLDDAETNLGQFIDCGTFVYCGPFFIAAEHSPELHGLADQQWGWTYAPPRWLVPSLCCHWLLQADMVFAWINDTTCYGTLTEIGWAQMLKKPVFIGYSSWKLQRDMWFVAGGPQTQFITCGSPKVGLQAALRSEAWIHAA